VRRALSCLQASIATVVVLTAVLPAGAATGTTTPDATTRAARSATLVHEPVLLVHGFNGSGAGWHAMVASLEAAGWLDEIDAMSYDSTRSNVDVGHRIAREVAALRARTGAARIDVVSHSMGAISSRWYLEHLGGAAVVDAWASLGGLSDRWTHV
jgi:triacylglycerol lipase